MLLQTAGKLELLPRSSEGLCRKLMKMTEPKKCFKRISRSCLDLLFFQRNLHRRPRPTYLFRRQPVLQVVARCSTRSVADDELPRLLYPHNLMDVRTLHECDISNSNLRKGGFCIFFITFFRVPSTPLFPAANYPFKNAAFRFMIRCV